MTNEESYLNSKMSRENHFRVPDGYFDQLTSSVMSRLPADQQKPARSFVLRPLLYAAAIACIALVCVGVYFNRNVQPMETEPQVTASATISDSYIDEAADYMMMDHQDIYACLTSDY